MKYTVTNIDNIKKQFNSDELFVDYVKRIAIENGDIISITDKQSAINYIKSFCSNLSLAYWC